MRNLTLTLDEETSKILEYLAKKGSKSEEDIIADAIRHVRHCSIDEVFAVPLPGR